MGNYVEIINNLIPDGVIKIKEDSKRISEKIRVLCWKINEKTKKLRRSGSIFLRKEHRMISLKGRERKKRTYTKVNEEFWSKGKGDLTKQIKRGCVSSQKANTEEDTGSNRTVDSQEASSNGKRKKTKSQVQSKKKRCTKNKSSRNFNDHGKPLLVCPWPFYNRIVLPSKSLWRPRDEMPCFNWIMHFCTLAMMIQQDVPWGWLKEKLDWKITFFQNFPLP